MSIGSSTPPRRRKGALILCAGGRRQRHLGPVVGAVLGHAAGRDAAPFAAFRTGLCTRSRRRCFKVASRRHRGCRDLLGCWPPGRPGLTALVGAVGGAIHAGKVLILDGVGPLLAGTWSRPVAGRGDRPLGGCSQPTATNRAGRLADCPAGPALPGELPPRTRTRDSGPADVALVPESLSARKHHRDEAGRAGQPAGKAQQALSPQAFEPARTAGHSAARRSGGLMPAPLACGHLWRRLGNRPDLHVFAACKAWVAWGVPMARRQSSRGHGVGRRQLARVHPLGSGRLSSAARRRPGQLDRARLHLADDQARLDLRALRQDTGRLTCTPSDTQAVAPEDHPSNW